MIRRQEPERAWRWMALGAVVLNIAVNYISDSVLPGQPIDVVTQQYNSLFTPAGYAFAIWGLIYITFIVYSVYQLFPSQRNEILFDRLARPFTISNFLAIAWIVTYRLDFILISTTIILSMLTLSISMYLKVRHVVLRHDRSNWISIPFSLFSGWLAVASLANISVLLVSRGWSGSLPTQLTVTMVMILAAGLLGIFVSYRCADFIFPAVITWACVAICVAHGGDYYAIGAVALISASLPIVWFLLAWVKRTLYHQRVWANKLSFDETMRLKLNGQNKLFFGRL